jgi:asparagine synthetase B (glutamine-hydrolysing)
MLGLKYVNPLLARLERRLPKSLISAYLQETKTIGYPLDNVLMSDELFSYNRGHIYRDHTPANLFFDQFMYMPDSLMYKNDITSMNSSIEARVPLVDREVLCVANSLPLKYRLSPEYSGKKVLKSLLKKYIPAELVDRPKKGFGFSFEKFSAQFFLDDYKAAAKFHLANSEEFAIDSDLKSLLSESKAGIICKKFPRFAFSLITNHLVFKAF